MDSRKLSKILLNEPSSNWPGDLKDERVRLDILPARDKDVLRERIREAVERKKIGSIQKKRRQRRIIWTAAAVLLLASAGGMFRFFSGQEHGPSYNMKIVRQSGALRIERDNKNVTPRVSDFIRESDALFLDKRSSIVFSAGPALFQLQGPAAVVFARLREKELLFRVDRGRIAVRSEGPKHGRIVWEAKELRFLLIGTVASLEAGEERRLLTVLEGVFEVRSRDGSALRVVEAGRSLLAKNEESATDLPDTRALQPEERSALLVFKNRMERISRGQPVLDEQLDLKTEEEIRRHYGALHTVALKDGREYRGFAVRSDKLVRVHTIFGVVDLNHKEVEFIR